MGGTCSTFSRKIHAQKTLTEELEETRPFWRLRLGREDTIKIDLQEVWCEDVDLIHLTPVKNHWHTFVHTLLKFCVQEHSLTA
jgi:hypothetical protein